MWLLLSAQFSIKLENKKVFISYSRDDRDLVVRVVEALRTKGLEVWFDAQISTGTDWDEVLEKQIIEADNMVLFLSKTSVASDYVKNELFFAQQNGTIVNPVLIEPCQLPLAMARMHYVDLTQDFDKGVDRLYQDITHGPDEGTNTKTTKEKEPKTPLTKKLVLLVAIILIPILAWQFWPNKGTVADDTIEEFVDDSGWRKLDENSSVEDYVSYIANYGNEELHLDDAIEQVQNNLKQPGLVIINKEELKENFYKLAFYFEDRYIVNKRDGENFEWPSKGDLLIARKQITVLDPKDYDVVAGHFIYNGQVIQYDVTLVEDEETAAILYYYQPQSGD